MGFTDGYYTTKTVKHDCLELYFYEFLQYAKCGQFVISDIDNLAENMGDVIEDQLKKAA